MRPKEGSDWLSCYTSQAINLRRCDRKRVYQIQRHPINFLRRGTQPLRKLRGGGAWGRATVTVCSNPRISSDSDLWILTDYFHKHIPPPTVTWRGIWHHKAKLWFGCCHDCCPNELTKSVCTAASSYLPTTHSYRSNKTLQIPKLPGLAADLTHAHTLAYTQWEF